MLNHPYSQLQSIKETRQQIPAEKVDVIGWEIKNEAGAYIGKTIDLLYELQSKTVRYLVVDLKGNGMNLDDKSVMIPVGLATLHPQQDEIILPNIHIDQFIALPDYKKDAVNLDQERNIREIIGSPAALRIEETIAELDQQSFYAHHLFNNGNLFNRGEAVQKFQTDPQRETEQHTIHELIENSKSHDLHAADEQTGQSTHHNEHRGFTTGPDQKF